MVLTLLALAHAESAATSFATDAGDWEGGSLGDGVLVVTESTSLVVDGMASFTLTARLRLVDGQRFALAAGSSTFEADYAEAQRLSLDSDTAPFPPADVEFSTGTTVADNLGEPELARWGDSYLLCGTRDGGVVLASGVSTESLTTFSSVVANASGPDLVVETSGLALYFARDGAIHRATSPDGLAFTEAGEVLSPGPDFDSEGLAAPSVVVDDNGTYHLYYSVPATGGTGYATSADGVSFTRLGELSADGDRLGLADVSYDAGTFEAIYSMGDSLGLALGGTDPTFASTSSDIRPLVESRDASWGDGDFGAATLVREGDTWLAWVGATDEGTPMVGELIATPEPGSWVSLVLDWDGATLSARYDDTELVSAAEAVDSFTFTVEGTLEIDEVEVLYTTISDTGVLDTGLFDEDDTAMDTATPASDTATADTASDFPGYNAGEWLGDPGGCGCNAGTPVAPAFSLGWLLLLRRVRGSK